VLLCNEAWSIALINKQNKLKTGEGLLMSRGFFSQKLLKGLCKNTLGVATPTVFPPAVTRLFFSVLFHLMIFAGQTRLDNHCSSTS
jgi:hypothetical protein